MLTFILLATTSVHTEADALEVMGASIYPAMVEVQRVAEAREVIAASSKLPIFCPAVPAAYAAGSDVAHGSAAPPAASRWAPAVVAL
jgi:hypothetical protein